MIYEKSCFQLKYSQHERYHDLTALDKCFYEYDMKS